MYSERPRYLPVITIIITIRTTRISLHDTIKAFRKVARLFSLSNGSIWDDIMDVALEEANRRRGEWGRIQ